MPLAQAGKRRTPPARVCCAVYHVCVLYMCVLYVCVVVMVLFI